jgi:hypothetical protein
MRYVLGFVLVLAVFSATSCGDGEATSPEDVCESFRAREAECLPPEYQSSDCEAHCLCLLGISLGDAACAETGPALVQVYACGAALSCGDCLRTSFKFPQTPIPARRRSTTSKTR